MARVHLVAREGRAEALLRQRPNLGTGRVGVELALAALEEIAQPAGGEGLEHEPAVGAVVRLLHDAQTRAHRVPDADRGQRRIEHVGPLALRRRDRELVAQRHRVRAECPAVCGARALADAEVIEAERGEAMARHRARHAEAPLASDRQIPVAAAQEASGQADQQRPRRAHGRQHQVGRDLQLLAARQGSAHVEPRAAALGAAGGREGGGVRAHGI